ncbi:glutaredoxin family protein [Jonesiaceae bacterium BS-20]|uniref:Glutaredoxin family protein n=1 Tax=Jonesiaceae bacterium BS-20 TaxID=3120821 RepID=A0AAU7DUM7_9MICO
MNSSEQAHAGSPSVTARVIVYTRADCPLCDVAIQTVTEVCAELDQTFALVDVDSSPQLRSQWSDYVPVVEVDGVQQGFWRIDEARLRRVLGA